MTQLPLYALYFHGTDEDEGTWMHDEEGRTFVFKHRANAQTFASILLSSFEEIDVRLYSPKLGEWMNWQLEEKFEQGKRVRESA